MAGNLRRYGVARQSRDEWRAAIGAMRYPIFPASASSPNVRPPGRELEHRIVRKAFGSPFARGDPAVEGPSTAVARPAASRKCRAQTNRAPRSAPPVAANSSSNRRRRAAHVASGPPYRAESTPGRPPSAVTSRPESSPNTAFGAPARAIAPTARAPSAPHSPRRTCRLRLRPITGERRNSQPKGAKIAANSCELAVVLRRDENGHDSSTSATIVAFTR